MLRTVCLSDFRWACPAGSQLVGYNERSPLAGSPLGKPDGELPFYRVVVSSALLRLIARGRTSRTHCRFQEQAKESGSEFSEEFSNANIKQVFDAWIRQRFVGNGVSPQPRTYSC